MENNVVLNFVKIPVQGLPARAQAGVASHEQTFDSHLVGVGQRSGQRSGQTSCYLSAKSSARSSTRIA